MKFRILYLIFLLTISNGMAQDIYKTAFENGKSLFNNGRYELAMEALKPAMDPGKENDYSSYASFYYAVSAYRAGYKPLARDMFLQIIERNDQWDYKNECRYWVTLIYFEEEELEKGMVSGALLSGSTLETEAYDLETKYLLKIDSVEYLSSLYNHYPEDKALANVIVSKMESASFKDLDLELLTRVANDHQIKIVTHAVPKEIIKKDVYRVAVLFPFLFQNMEASGYYLRKSLVVDIYEGIRMGVEKLRETGVKIELIAYDTKGDTTTTKELLSMPEMNSVDLIIGPLVQGPSRLVSEFAYDHKINMINPVSINSGVIGSNPYTFYLNPSDKTLGKAAGTHVSHGHGIKNKNTMIFYGYQDSDYRMAREYANFVKTDTFNIIGIYKVHRDSTERIFDYLTAKRNVKDSLGNQVYVDIKGEKEKRRKLEEYIIAPDSIGSIFVATFDYKIASEVFSSVADRGDSIQIIGHGSWLLDKTANYRSMQRLGTWMLAPDYVDYSGYTYLEFESKYINKQHFIPSKYVMAGYDCMLFAGYSLSNFGIYFQNGLNDTVVENVGLRKGYDFREANDSQYIPLISFEGLGITIMNSGEVDR